MRDLTGKILDERLCPRCDLVRIIRLGAGAECLCLHCGHRWTPQPAAAEPVEAPLRDRLRTLFTELELQRLLSYRAAVQAGFFQEWSC